jgi:hypothetical protein
MDISAVIYIVAFYGFIIGSSAWVAYDSSKISLRHYLTGLSYKPRLLFFLVVASWCISIPWYLVIRHRIKHGKITPIGPNASSHLNGGWRSPRGKFGLFALFAGILITQVHIFLPNSEDALATWSPWMLWSIWAVMVLGLLSIVFGSILVLYTVTAKWMTESKSIHKKSIHKKSL